jgi:hypothetical protein
MGGVCLLTAGCASAPRKWQFAKVGVLESQRQSDSDACWDYVMNSPEGRQQVDLLKASRVIGGGVFALAMMGSEQRSRDYDVRKDPSYWPVHNDCMTRKGYAVSMAE